MVPKAAVTVKIKKIVDGDTVDVMYKGRTERLRIWSGACDGGTPAPKPSPKPSPTPSGGGGGSKPTSSPTPSPTPSGGSGGDDPRFDTCAKANAAGYGPYHKGTDPEYAWYQDRDGDGIVCER
uniref:excalibur calcium-binding domain-containing protein n=1 Tax=Herbidospora sakaeratensis TaxID=564415 RepID=UPI000783474E|nr:excalibur calcium-binding domain-containing protein [Herbidospora sakaeratensis]